MKVFSFDAETNGLYGQAFIIAAVVTDDGGKIAEFVARCPIAGDVDGWVAENVLPAVNDINISHAGYPEMLQAFWKFYSEHAPGTVVIAHMAFPVETKVLRDMIEADLADRQWIGPYPLIDVASTLDAAGYESTSVDAYNSQYGLVAPSNGVTHHPLYDSGAAEICYRHLVK